MRTYFLRAAKDEDDSPEINMAPMLDVIFILFIFFVVSTTIYQESVVEIDRPKATTATPQSQPSTTITIDRNGGIWFNDAPIDIRSIKAKIKASGKHLPILIKADRSSKNGVLVEVLDEIRKAGIERIAIAADSDD